MLAPRRLAAAGLTFLAACSHAAPAMLPPAQRAFVEPVEPTPRYAIPTCPLRYEMKTVETSHVDGITAAMEEKMGTALLTFATIDARPSGKQLELVTAISVQPLMGKHRASLPPDTSMAPVHLETDGTRWIERDGPTQLYDRIGTQGGLQWFFPDLPASGAVATSTDWEVPRRIASDAAATPLPGTRLKVVVERWTEEKGVKVVELSATGTEHVSDATASAVVGLVVTATFTYRGAYRVTATGRLLRASIEKDGVIDMRGPDPQSSQRQTQHASRTMSLVGACDGPTEPTLMTPLTLEERAIKAWTDTWMAFKAGERDKVLAALDPQLRTKLGDARLWDTLTSYTALRGDKSLAPAVMVRDEDVSVVGATVRLVVHGVTLDPKTKSSMPLDVVISLRDGGDGWLIESLRADLELDEKGNLLEISRDRAVVRKGWPPK